MSDEENIVEFEVLDGAKTDGGKDATGNADVIDDDVQSRTGQPEEADVYESQPEDVEPQTEPAEQPQPEPEGTPLNSLRGVLGNKTLEDVIEREAKEEQDTSSPFSLSRTLGGVIISRFVRRQMGVVLLISVFVLIYISLRYMCQKKLVEIDRTEAKIVDARYKATVCTSKLTEASRESNVLKRLAECGDSTLTIADEPPYLIKIEEEN